MTEPENQPTKTNTKTMEKPTDTTNTATAQALTTPSGSACIDFIAQGINEMTAKSEGFSCATRWGTLRDDLKTKYREQAKEIVMQWIESEAVAKKSREANDPLAFFTQNVEVEHE